MKLFRSKSFALTALLNTALLGCGGSGFLGLQDYQRDLIFGVGGGLASALLAGAVADDNTATTAPAVPGPPGDAGPQGPPGPPLFSKFVDTFFSGQVSDVLGVVPVRDDEPTLGLDGSALAFSTTIPNSSEGVNPVNMRLFLFRTGPCTGGCFIFTVDARRLESGASGPTCLGGEGADCAGGTRWIRVTDACVLQDSKDAGDGSAFLVIDLPLGSGGLDFPLVNPGDFLAIELNTFSNDGATYNLLGVELANVGEELDANAEIFFSQSSVPSECSPQP